MAAGHRAWSSKLTKLLLLSSLCALWASSGVLEGVPSLSQATPPPRTFLLLAETAGSQVAPLTTSQAAEGVAPAKAPSAPGEGLGRSGFTSFCGWAVSSLVSGGLLFTFASGKQRARVRGAWRTAMDAVARWRGEARPKSYGAALLNPPQLDFLLLHRPWEEEDEQDMFRRNADSTVVLKTRSLPASLPSMSTSNSEDSPLADNDEAISFTRHPFGRTQQRAPTLLQQRETQCKGSTAQVSTKPTDFEDESSFAEIPSVRDLRRIFIVQAAKSECLEDAVISAIQEMKGSGSCKVAFQDADAKKFYAMLSKNGTEEVSAHSFAVEMRQLLSALDSCDQLSLPQLRSIMATAFDRFDFNEDGVLSIAEFSCALQSFDINLGSRETETLLRFLSQTACDAVSKESPPVLEKEDLTKADSAELTLEDKCFAAANGLKEHLQSASGWNTAVTIAGKITRCLQQPGSPRRQVKRLMDLGHKELASATEISLTLVAVAMVVLHHSQFHPDAAFLEQVADAWDDCTGAVQDLFQVIAPGPALLSGALGIAKLQKDSVALDVDEALLYARYFLPKGCSQSLFHKLLTLAGCHWGTISAGQQLEEDGELRILVRGKAIRKHGEVAEDLLPGDFLASCGETVKCQVVALEDLTYMAWNTEKLNACIKSVKDAELKELAQKLLEDASATCDESPAEASEEDWFAPVGEALESQAERRGLVTSSLCPEGFCRILSKPNMSLREKMDQVHAWILSSKDEILSGLEAASDLATLGSLLFALSTHSQTLSPENFSQLAPLLILLAEVISKKRSTCTDEEMTQD